MCNAAIAVALLWVCAIAGARPQQSWKTASTDRDNRYEGFITEQSGNPKWELLSFTAGRPSIPAASVIRVAFYLPDPPAASSSSTTVVACELEDLHHYRMESKPRAWRQGWNVFEPWKASDVIDTKPGLRGNLGIAVYPESGRATATEVLPALVIVAPGAFDSVITSYEAVMRSNKTVSSIVWRLARVEGTTAVPVWEQRAPGDFIRQEPIRLDVKVPAEDGRYRLLVCATPRLALPEQSTAPANCSRDDIGQVYTFHHVAHASIH